MHAKQHRTRKRALGWWKGVEQRQREPSGPAHEWKIGFEEPHEPVRESDTRYAIGKPAPRVIRQHGTVAQRVARRCNDRVRELECVAHAEIETLSRNRVQRLRCIADHYNACANRGPRDLERKRERTARADADEAFETRTEAHGQRV